MSDMAGGTEPNLAGTDAAPAGAQTADGAGHSRADVVDILLAQHEQLKDLLDRTSAADGEAKEQLFAELTELLKNHEKGEQRVVHPVTRQSIAGGVTSTNLRLGEEQRADQLIADLKEVPAGTDGFDARFERLRKAVLDHAAHEESEEFPKLRREVDAARLRTMAEELVAVQNARN